MDRLLKLIQKHKGVSIFVLLIIIFGIWFFAREIQVDLPYKLSGSEVLEIKEKCKELAENKESKWQEVFTVELVGSGYSERGGFCYMEYLYYFDDWTAKILYNTTEEKEIRTSEWPENISSYKRAFDWFIYGKKRYYQNTF